MISAMAVVGIATTLTGSIIGAQGASKQQSAAQTEAAITQQELEEQKQQMQLQFQRQQRSIVRQSIQARAQSKTVANSQGAMMGSALPGAYGGIAGATNNSGLENSQNYQFGIDKVNLEESKAAAAAAAGKGAYESQIGSSLTSLGGSLISNMGNFNSIGKQWFGPKAS